VEGGGRFFYDLPKKQIKKRKGAQKFKIIKGHIFELRNSKFKIMNIK